MRSITRIIVHCSATRPGLDIGVDEIDRWHRERGFHGVGYHAVIRRNGVVEPLVGARRAPEELRIEDGRLRETISAKELNSRKRALLLRFRDALRERDLLNRRDLRILAPEALSRTALILRGRFPYFYGTEYLPTEEARERYFPVPHLDLENIGHDAERFDAFISGDVFEHVADLDAALKEIHRVLKPNGFLVSSFPFSPWREETEIRASIDRASGDITHHRPAQYHGNPVDPENGSLVFSLPGWDIVDRLRNIGFVDARFHAMLSSRHGVVADLTPFVFILTAAKA